MRELILTRLQGLNARVYWRENTPSHFGGPTGTYTGIEELLKAVLGVPKICPPASHGEFWYCSLALKSCQMTPKHTTLKGPLFPNETHSPLAPVAAMTFCHMLDFAASTGCHLQQKLMSLQPKTGLRSEYAYLLPLLCVKVSNCCNLCHTRTDKRRKIKGHPGRTSVYSTFPCSR